MGEYTWSAGGKFAGELPIDNRVIGGHVAMSVMMDRAGEGTAGAGNELRRCAFGHIGYFSNYDCDL